MATGLFNLKQVNQATQQSAWSNVQPTYYGSFNGSSQTIYASANSLNIRTTSFTMEGYFYANTLNQNGGLFGATTPTFYIQINTAGRIFVSDGTTDTITALYGNAFQPQTWTHIALSFDGTTYRVFFNGVLLASSTTLLASNTLTNLYIGLSPSNGLYFNGQISNFRFVKGTALYTANFAPPTGPLTAVANTSLLTLQNATIVDNSTNAFSITNTGSVTTTQSNLVFGNSNKTPAVDFLVVAGGGGAGASNPGGAGAGGVLVGSASVVAGSAITVTVGAGGNGTSGSNAPTSGSNSVFGSQAAVGGGQGGNNGIKGGDGGSGGGSTSANATGGQGTANQGFGGGATFVLGGGGATGGGGGAGGVGQSPIYYNVGGQGGNGLGSVITGAMSGYGGGGAGSTGNIGTGLSTPEAAYGGGGGPPSGNGQPGTANTGGGGGGAPSYTGGGGGSGIVAISYPDVYAPPTTLTGTFTASTSGSGSIYFNGTNQLLVYNANTAFQFGTGNFTWETWVNYLGGTGALFDLGSANSAGGFAVFISSGTLYVRIDGSGNDLTYTLPSGFVGGWVHLAVVRNGTTMTLYYNGTSVASGTRSNNLTQQTPYIGNLNGFSGYYLGGNLSNNRVVKGTAVYTGNFTPSTTPLAAVSGTSLLLNSVSGAYLADGSTNGFAPTTGTVAPTWASPSPFTVTGYKNRVYTWTSSGTITF